MFFLILLIIAILLLGSIAFMVFIFSVTIWADLKGAPFVRSRKDRIKTMLELADIQTGTRVLELGSGDGTLLITAAQRGADAEGIEINPFLVWYSKYRIRKLGLQANTRVAQQNLFDISLTDKNPDVIFLYLLPTTLKQIKEKFLTELAPHTRIVSNGFRIDGLTPVAEKNNVYTYHV